MNHAPSTSSSSRPRVLIIGIDGATFDVIRPLADAGRLPNLGRLMREGCWGPLRSTVPPLTAPAWTSFMTGVNPGQHGLFDFRYRGAGSYELFTNNTTTNSAPLLWEILSQHGKRCCVLNVPATYPARPINGEMVTGMLTPADADDFTYPAGLAAEIRRAFPGYSVWPAEIRHAKGRERSFLESTRRLTDMGVRLFHFMQPRGDWDAQMIVFMATDQVQHAMWHFRDATHRAHPADAPADFRNAIDACYEQVDAAIGEILASVDDQTTILVMSDHGFGPWEYWFHCNAWLLAQGFLVVKSDALSRLKYALFRLGVAPLTFYKLAMGMKMGEAVARTTLHRREWSFNLLRRLFISFDDVDWSRTTAYSLGNLGQIFLNRAGREPQGIVTDADYDAVLTRIVDRLRAEKNPANGQPLMGEVLRGRDLYAGKRANEGPDLMPVPADPRILGFGTAQFTSQRLLTPAFGMTGGHRMDGVFIAAGRGIRGGQTVAGSRLWDVAPTIMALMGVPVPAGLDGRVLDSILTPGMCDQVRYDERPYQDYFHDGGQGYSEDEEALVAERLKGLGYV